MNTNSDISAVKKTKTRTGLMVVAVFLFAALVILLSVLTHEQSLSLDEQAMSEQIAVSLPPELLELRAKEDSLLNTAEVIDSAAAVYRIPIERAMELMVEEAGQ